MVLLLNINGKPYMRSPMTLSHLTLSYLERSNSRSVRLRFRSLISRKGAELGHMLLPVLDINRKQYMGSPMTLSHLTLGDLERPISRSLRGQRLKAAELRHMLLLKMSYQLQLSSRGPRSIDLLFNSVLWQGC